MDTTKMDTTKRTLEVFRLGHLNPFLDLGNYSKASNPGTSRPVEFTINTPVICTTDLEPHELELQDAAGLESAVQAAEFALGQEMMKRFSPVDLPKDARGVPCAYDAVADIRKEFVGPYSIVGDYYTLSDLRNYFPLPRGKFQTIQFPTHYDFVGRKLWGVTTPGEWVERYPFIVSESQPMTLEISPEYTQAGFSVITPFSIGEELSFKVDFQWCALGPAENPDGTKWFGRIGISYSLGDTKHKRGFLVRRPTQTKI